jgi:hypothetical protein
MAASSSKDFYAGIMSRPVAGFKRGQHPFAMMLSSATGRFRSAEREFPTFQFS